MTKQNVIYLNHKNKACGVYQYGYRSAKILQKSNVYNFIYVEVETEQEYVNAMNIHNPIGVIYNYHTGTMGWLGMNAMNKYPKLTHYGLYHEGIQPVKQFNYILYVDSTYPDDSSNFSIPRPLFEHNFPITKPEIPTFSSFGFGFKHKGFERIVKVVNDQFDDAIVRLHMSVRAGTDANALAARCNAEVKKKGIKLEITNAFLEDDDILKLLSSSTGSIFLYDRFENSKYALSSVIDYALSVDVPLIINKSNMFIHINNSNPSICIEDRSISDIVNSGIDIVRFYRDKWSNDNFIGKYEDIMNRTCVRK